jgi:hypothetical protein
MISVFFSLLSAMVCLPFPVDQRTGRHSLSLVAAFSLYHVFVLLQVFDAFKIRF